MNADVVFGGRAAHSARPWEGENAIDKAAAALVPLRGAHAARPVEVDGLTFHDVMTVTHVEAGVARNVVPDALRAGRQRALRPGRSLDDARPRWRSWPAPRASVRWLDESPSALAVASATRSCSASSPRPARPSQPKQAWTDVATLIPAASPP